MGSKSIKRKERKGAGGSCIVTLLCSSVLLFYVSFDIVKLGYLSAQRTPAWSPCRRSHKDQNPIEGATSPAINILPSAIVPANSMVMSM